MIRLDAIRNAPLEHEPYEWARIDGLFSEDDGRDLVDSYPHDHFKLVSGYGGEKDYEYHARQLVPMSSQSVSHREQLSTAWKALADDFLSRPYREAMSNLTGRDLVNSDLEVNVFHYGGGASLGSHTDLPDKIVTHVLYFNESWNPDDGGCLQILRSRDMASAAAMVPPLIGTSAVLVRSNQSWHAVSPVVRHSAISRRSLTVTFYVNGSSSSMWPVGDETVLTNYPR